MFKNLKNHRTSLCHLFAVPGSKGSARKVSRNFHDSKLSSAVETHVIGFSPECQEYQKYITASDPMPLVPKDVLEKLGFSNAKPECKPIVNANIVGGENAQEGEFPHMVCSRHWQPKLYPKNSFHNLLFLTHFR